MNSAVEFLSDLINCLNSTVSSLDGTIKATNSSLTTKNFNDSQNFKLNFKPIQLEQTSTWLLVFANPHQLLNYFGFEYNTLSLLKQISLNPYTHYFLTYFPVIIGVLWLSCFLLLSFISLERTRIICLISTSVITVFLLLAGLYLYNITPKIQILKYLALNDVIYLTEHKIQTPLQAQLVIPDKLMKPKTNIINYLNLSKFDNSLNTVKDVKYFSIYNVTNLLSFSDTINSKLYNIKTKQHFCGKNWFVSDRGSLAYDFWMSYKKHVKLNINQINKFNFYLFFDFERQFYPKVWGNRFKECFTLDIEKKKQIIRIWYSNFNCYNLFLNSTILIVISACCWSVLVAIIGAIGLSFKINRKKLLKFIPFKNKIKLKIKTKFLEKFTKYDIYRIHGGTGAIEFKSLESFPKQKKIKNLFIDFSKFDFKEIKKQFVNSFYNRAPTVTVIVSIITGCFVMPFNNPATAIIGLLSLFMYFFNKIYFGFIKSYIKQLEIYKLVYNTIYILFEYMRFISKYNKITTQKLKKKNTLKSFYNCFLDFISKDNDFSAFFFCILLFLFIFVYKQSGVLFYPNLNTISKPSIFYFIIMSYCLVGFLVLLNWVLYTFFKNWFVDLKFAISTILIILNYFIFTVFVVFFTQYILIFFNQNNPLVRLLPAQQLFFVIFFIFYIYKILNNYFIFFNAKVKFFFILSCLAILLLPIIFLKYLYYINLVFYLFILFNLFFFLFFLKSTHSYMSIYTASKATSSTALLLLPFINLLMFNFSQFSVNFFIILMLVSVLFFSLFLIKKNYQQISIFLIIFTFFAISWLLLCCLNDFNVTIPGTFFVKKTLYNNGWVLVVWTWSYLRLWRLTKYIKHSEFLAFMALIFYPYSLNLTYNWLGLFSFTYYDKMFTLLFVFELLSIVVFLVFKSITLKNIKNNLYDLTFSSLQSIRAVTFVFIITFYILLSLLLVLNLLKFDTFFILGIVLLSVQYSILLLCLTVFTNSVRSGAFNDLQGILLNFRFLKRLLFFFIFFFFLFIVLLVINIV